MSQAQNLTDKWFMDVAQVYSPTFQRLLFAFYGQKAIIFCFLFFDFLQILAKASSNTFSYCCSNHWLVVNFAVAVLLELSNTFVQLPRLATLLLGTCCWNHWITWNHWVAGENFQNSIVQGGSDKHKEYLVLYNMLQRDYKTEKMKLSAREKIRLKLFSTRQILSCESIFLCVNWIGFSLVTVKSLWDERKSWFTW